LNGDPLQAGLDKYPHKFFGALVDRTVAGLAPTKHCVAPVLTPSLSRTYNMVSDVNTLGARAWCSTFKKI